MQTFTLRVENTGDKAERVILFDQSENPEASPNVNIQLVDSAETYAQFMDKNTDFIISRIYSSKEGFYAIQSKIGDTICTAPLHVVSVGAEYRRKCFLGGKIEVNPYVTIKSRDLIQPNEVMYFQCEIDGEPMLKNSNSFYPIVIENKSDEPLPFSILGYDSVTYLNLGNPEGISISYGYIAYDYPILLNMISERTEKPQISQIYSSIPAKFEIYRFDLMNDKEPSIKVIEALPYPQKSETQNGLELILDDYTKIRPHDWQLSANTKLNIELEVAENATPKTWTKQTIDLKTGKVSIV